MKSRIRRYEGNPGTVTYDIPRCIHVAECVRRLPAVFDPKRRPWILPARAGADELAETVAACPTGALHFERADGAAEVTPPVNTATVQPNGPLYVAGAIEVAEGNEVTLRDTRVAFCRCGDSANTPLCDLAHAEAGFQNDGLLTGGPPESGGDASGPVRFTPVPNGPVRFQGPLVVTDAQGNRRTVTKGALCRCGHTKTTPFCDGSHKAAGFRTEQGVRHPGRAGALRPPGGMGPG